jgi:Fic family protein
LEEAATKLKKFRPLSQDKLRELEKELLIKFTHSSLHQEGNTISIEETVLLSNAISNNTPTFDNNQPLFDTTKQERLEATNHLTINEQTLKKLIKSIDPLTESDILDLHNQLMKELLTKEKEGIAGQYRKVGIKVNNSNVPRPASSEVQGLMEKWFQGAIQSEEETFISYLARIHQQFQLIHPFRDGNGRIGRLILCILAVRRGYPYFYFEPENRPIFSDAVDQSHHNNFTLFKRLLLEAFYSSFVMYEKVLGTMLVSQID